MPKRVKALSGIKVCSVTAGVGASCAVSAAGALFTWGSGQFGRLGHGEKANYLAPRRVEALQAERGVAVSAGAWHNIAVTRGGSVFGWGIAGALGLPDNASAVAAAAEDVGAACILSACRYPQLSCARSP